MNNRPMRHSEVHVASVFGHRLSVRTLDFYVKPDGLGVAYGKSWPNWYNLGDTTDLIQAVAKAFGIPSDDVVVKGHDRIDPSCDGWWMHEALFYGWAFHCDKMVYAQALKVLTELRERADRSVGEHLEAIRGGVSLLVEGRRLDFPAAFATVAREVLVGWYHGCCPYCTRRRLVAESGNWLKDASHQDHWNGKPSDRSRGNFNVLCVACHQKKSRDENAFRLEHESDFRVWQKRLDEQRDGGLF